MNTTTLIYRTLLGFTGTKEEIEKRFSIGDSTFYRRRLDNEIVPVGAVKRFYCAKNLKTKKVEVGQSYYMQNVTGIKDRNWIFDLVKSGTRTKNGWVIKPLGDQRVIWGIPIDEQEFMKKPEVLAIVKG